MGSYDANGNLTSDPVHSYTWDADGNAISIDGIGLTYDALDRMVEQNRSGSYTQVVYGPDGGKLALMNGQTLSKAFVPLAGGATAVYNASGLAYYRHPDWLGSSRFASLSTGSNRLYYDGAYAPYGENYAEMGTPDRSFTGQDQHTISTGSYPLYDFPAREYHPVWGRWLNPDPAGLAAADPSNPQTWNRYAYVGNSPTTHTDPLGMNQCIPWAGCQISIDPADPCSYLMSNDASCGQQPGFWGNGMPIYANAGSNVNVGITGGTTGVPGSGNGVWSENPGINIYGPPGSGGPSGPPCDFGTCAPGVPGSNGFAAEAAVGDLPFGGIITTTTWACGLNPLLCIAGAGVLANGVMYGALAYGGYRASQALASRIKAKGSGKETASDVPSWVVNYPRGPNERCGAYAMRVLLEKYGELDPRSLLRGPGSEYSKIKKACERGGI
jgi:RHS repeat-associated protein